MHGLSNTWPQMTVGATVLTPGLVEQLKPEQRIVVITDDIVAKLHLSVVLQALGGTEILPITIPSGEQHKNQATVTRIQEQMLSAGCLRNTVVVALGGGVVCDLAGFVASTYCRGVPLILLPTTLLAMVDAAIGGKNGINTSYGKNLIGCFYQPRAVFAELDFLQTLPKIQLRSAMAEIIKHGVILDSTYFEALEQGKLPMREMIARSMTLKSEVVQRDFTEQGVRSVLNFGHTVAHALERYHNYRLQHGSAVAVGMVVEAHISYQRGLLLEKEYQRIVAIVQHLALPNEQVLAKEDFIPLSDLMSRDKKNQTNNIHIVLLQKIGQAWCHEGQWAHPVTLYEVRHALYDYLKHNH